MHYYIGLDNGGTTTKAALFSSTGEEIAVCSMSTAMLTPQPDYVERDMEEMWQANCAVIRGVLEQSGVAPKDVACVGICGHGKGLYLWGKDGRPARRGIISSITVAGNIRCAGSRMAPRKPCSPVPASISWPVSRSRCWRGSAITSRACWKMCSGSSPVKTMSASD